MSKEVDAAFDRIERAAAEIASFAYGLATTRGLSIAEIGMALGTATMLLVEVTREMDAEGGLIDGDGNRMPPNHLGG